MDKRPIDIVEDNFSGVIGLELKGSLISGKGELISYFHKMPTVTWLILTCSWGEGTKMRLKSPGFQAKSRAFQN